MVKFLISLLIFLIILFTIWIILTKSNFGKKHFCYEHGKSLYDCGNNIKVCATKDSNIDMICSTIDTNLSNKK